MSFVVTVYAWSSVSRISNVHHVMHVCICKPTGSGHEKACRDSLLEFEVQQIIHGDNVHVGILIKGLSSGGNGSQLSAFTPGKALGMSEELDSSVHKSDTVTCRFDSVAAPNKARRQSEIDRK